MNQDERRVFLINYLLKENADFKNIAIPESVGEQRQLLRALMNIREAKPVSEEFLSVQNEYLQTVSAEKGVVGIEDTELLQKDIYLWQGDITRLSVDGIVNAANSGMTGCYQPNHSCIDNCIHTFSGVQLRLECAELMKKQGFPEPTGGAKITSAYNLPCKYVLHTVGPIVQGNVTREDKSLLSLCYQNCLETAVKNGLQSIAFCCISTGVFCFPNKKAAEIAVSTVKKYKAETKNEIKVVFNVFKDTDYNIYRELLGKN